MTKPVKLEEHEEDSQLRETLSDPEMTICGNRLTTGELLDIWKIYNDEHCHRDTMFWNQIFKYLWGILATMVLPYYIPDSLLQMLNVNRVVFPIIGLFLTAVFIHVFIGYILRLKKVDAVCGTINGMLPKKLQREKVCKLFGFRMSLLICIVLTVIY